MPQRYSLQLLTDRLEKGEKPRFLFFWGHTNKQNDPAGKFCFSQWYPAAFTVDGVEYKTAEHWMMAQKAFLFDDIACFDKIVQCKSPAEAKEIGGVVAGFDEQVWCEKRFELVKLGNIHKFNQHPAFAQYLLSTGDELIAEASPTDNIWGTGLAETHEEAHNIYRWGLNLLGFALMEVRDFLREFGHFNALENEVVPPWKKYPGIDPLDMFWRMGEGEIHIIETTRYWEELNERERIIYALTHPEPPGWDYFY